jgi:hypothetical protein
MAAGKYSFTIEQGTTTIFEIQYQDSSGTAIDLTGYNARMQIKPGFGADAILSMSSSLDATGIYQKGSNKAFLSMSGSNFSTAINQGKIGIYIGHEVTDDFNFGEAVYDLEISDGIDKTRILQGDVRLSREVTTI